VYAETTERSPIDWPLLHLSQGVSQANFTIFPSRRPEFCSLMLVVVTFASDKRFWMFDFRQKGLEGNTAVGGEEKESSAVTPTTRWISLRGLSIPIFPMRRHSIPVY
jgi:hypothetical protein